MVGPMELGVYLPVCFSLSRKTREGDVKSRHFLPTLVLSPQHSGLGPRGGGAGRGAPNSGVERRWEATTASSAPVSRRAPPMSLSEDLPGDN